MTDIPPAAGQQIAEDIEPGKTMAILCYIPVAMVGLIVSIICVVQANNAYSLYHAKQSLALAIVGVAAGLLYIPIGIACAFIPFLLLFLFPLAIIIGIAFLVLMIIGIINAAGGKYKPLPLVGGLADKFFGKIQKKS